MLTKLARELDRDYFGDLLSYDLLFPVYEKCIDELVHVHVC